MINSIFFSALEPYAVHPLLLQFCFYVLFDLSITNQVIVLTTVLVSTVYFFISLLSKKDKTLYIVPYRFQVAAETLYSSVLSLVIDNVKDTKGARYFPLVFYIFSYLACINAIGLVPFNFAVTSHLIVTFFLSLSLFIAINIIGYRKHGLHIFSLFLPQGTSVPLSFLLVPIELISYIFRPISLAIRLFANIMAGHTLMHVMAMFSVMMLLSSSPLFLFPILICIPLLLLETAVAFIQAYVFSLLICIYFNDALSLH
jgi:ATP synthase subunit 6